MQERRLMLPLIPAFLSAFSRPAPLMLALGLYATGPLQAAPASAHPAMPQKSKPSAAVSGLPSPQIYKAGTPERALAEFLTAWQQRDFTRLAQFTDITWKHTDPAPVQALHKQFSPASLLGARIVGPGQDEWSPTPTENIVNLKMFLRYRSSTGLHTQTLSATVMRELRPYIQDRRGTWGVNPEFTIELDD